jgi:hypothetical protein
MSAKVYATSNSKANPLTTAILPAPIVAHHNFAVRLLKWLVAFLQRSSGFRKLFVELAFAVSRPNKIWKRIRAVIDNSFNRVRKLSDF